MPIWQNNQPEFVWISVERRTEALFGPAALLGFEVSDDSSDAAVDLEGTIECIYRLIIHNVY